MVQTPAARQPFNIMIVGQSGRLQYEALLFAASLADRTPDFAGRLFVATPRPGSLWKRDPGIVDIDVLSAFDRLGAEILPFDAHVFGDSYPQGNKIEALMAMPEGEPFIFFDSDTLITGDLTSVPFDFHRPGASQRCEGTWPQPTLYGPDHSGIWKSLYDKFDLDFDASRDAAQPEGYWRRYLYFNAGWFFHVCPQQFGQRFLDYARSIRDDPPAELICQSLDPWLDQIALPLVVHSFGGGRNVLPEGLLDGAVSCHYRHLPLLYARENDAVVDCLESVAAPNWLKKVLKAHEPIKRMVYQRRGAKVRALFDRDNLPRREQAIRNRIRSNGFWIR